MSTVFTDASSHAAQTRTRDERRAGVEDAAQDHFAWRRKSRIQVAER